MLNIRSLVYYLKARRPDVSDRNCLMALQRVTRQLCKETLRLRANWTEKVTQASWSQGFGQESYHSLVPVNPSLEGTDSEPKTYGSLRVLSCTLFNSSGIPSTAVVAAPAPTTTAFSVTPGTGANFPAEMWIQVGATQQQTQVQSQTGDNLVVAPPILTPNAGDVVAENRTAFNPMYLYLIETDLPRLRQLAHDEQTIFPGGPLPHWWADADGTLVIYPPYDQSQLYDTIIVEAALVITSTDFEQVLFPQEFEDALINGGLQQVYEMAGKGQDIAISKEFGNRFQMDIARLRGMNMLGTSGSPGRRPGPFSFRVRTF